MCRTPVLPIGARVGGGPLAHERHAQLRLGTVKTSDVRCLETRFQTVSVEISSQLASR